MTIDRGFTMPVLDGLAAQAARMPGRSLKDTVVLHVNHCMDNSFYFSEILNDLFARAVFVGMPYNDMSIEGSWSFIPYYGKKIKNIFELWNGQECFFRGNGDFLDVSKRLIEAALEESILPYLKEGKRLLIIEDGGYHYPVLRKFLERYPEFEGCVCGSVEQTSSGTVRCREFGRKHGYRYPCGSISRSDIKMHIESRFIGHRVVEELAYFLYSANSFPDFHHILLLGYGIVGRQVARDLTSRRCLISVIDTDERIAASAESAGYRLVKQVDADVFSTDTIIIGNTGVRAFTEEMLTAFFESRSKKLYLASSSSQDREFRTFLDMADGILPWPEGTVLQSCEDHEFYTLFRFQYGETEKLVYLIAEGLPLNFYRKGGVSLTYSIIDLIFAEMLSMGLAFHFEDHWEKRLWLLGREKENLLFLSEEELVHLWFADYSLVGRTEAEQLPIGHPEADYLRERMMREG